MRDIIVAAANLLAGIVLVITGGADRLWYAIEPAIPWRTGPTAQSTFLYLAALAAGWLILNLLLGWLLASARRENPIEPLILRACGFIVSAAVIIAVQVLVPHKWLLVTAAGLLIAMLLERPAKLRASLLTWAWITTGIILSSPLINPWFIGQPTFIPRLAIVLSAWRTLGMLPPLRIRFAELWIADWLA